MLLFEIWDRLCIGNSLMFWKIPSIPRCYSKPLWKFSQTLCDRNVLCSFLRTHWANLYWIYFHRNGDTLFTTFQQLFVIYLLFLQCSSAMAVVWWFMRYLAARKSEIWRLKSHYLCRSPLIDLFFESKEWILALSFDVHKWNKNVVLLCLLFISVFCVWRLKT